MQPDYLVRILDGDDLMRAYAVMRAVLPWLALADWQALTALAAQRRDWLAALDTDGYVHGLCHVLAEAGADTEPTLHVPLFAPISLFDEQGVANALLETIKGRAIQDGCSRVHIWGGTPPDRHSLMNLRLSLQTSRGQTGGVILDVLEGHRH